MQLNKIPKQPDCLLRNTFALMAMIHRDLAQVRALSDAGDEAGDYAFAS